MSVPNDNGGMKHDALKPRYDLIPPEATRQLAWVLTFGAEKYEDHNWMRGMNWSRVIGGAERHIAAIKAGEDVDPETGMAHAAHLMACATFLVSFLMRGLGVDDRMPAMSFSVMDATAQSQIALWASENPRPDRASAAGAEAVNKALAAMATLTAER